MVVPVHAPSSSLGLTASPHGLELGEGHYIGSLRSMPDCAPPSRVVVVKAATVVVKQLPPLVTVCLADRNAWRGIPAALTSGQVHIHMLMGAWLHDLHPVRAEWEETRQRVKCNLQLKNGNRLFSNRIRWFTRGHGHAWVLINSTSSKQLTLFDRLRGPKMPTCPYGESVNVCVPYMYPSASVCVWAMM